MKYVSSIMISAAVALALIGCATGSSILVGKARPPITPENVKLYVEAPEDYEVIGIVEASSDVEFSSQAAQNRAIERLKTEAAKIGANGVLLENSGEKSSTVFGSGGGGFFWAAQQKTKTVQGKAIFVPAKEQEQPSDDLSPVGDQQSEQ